MSVNLLELYFKFNFLIAAAFLLWLVARHVMQLLRLEPSHAQQLKLARLFMLGQLCVVPVVVLANGLIPGWLKGITHMAAGTDSVQEFTVVAGATVHSQYQFGLLTLDLALVVPALLLAGLLVQLCRLALQIGRLRKIVADATEWKSINGIHLLISTCITSPFSTRALGRKQVVLPAQLLESPRNLQLAVKHELQHVRNGDLEWVILLEAIKLLCFWNPVAWLWHNEFDCLQEFACDEVLVNERNVNSQAYGTCLLDVASVVSGTALLASSNMVPKFSLWQNHTHQLKRRIHLLTKVASKKNIGLKTLCYGLLIGFGLADTAVIVLAADSGANSTQSKKPDKDMVPVSRTNPEYPAIALGKRQEGYVVVDFTIDEEGNVQNAVAVKSCVGPQSGDLKNVCTAEDDTFKQSALNAVKLWKYNPKLNNGIAAKREHVQTMLRFQLIKDTDLVPLQRVHPVYPMRALSRGIEGWVTMQFNITETGSVTDAMVVDASPKGVFDEAALTAIRQWRYSANVENGKAVPRKGMQTMLRFQLEH